jgi:ferredoxin
MSIRAIPGFLGELQKYGEFDVTPCFNCGNCTAICPLSDDDATFPRRSLRYLQLGAKEKVLGSLDPWLCYYCGECTETCPRQADPSEAMMALRRYLTSKYDWTGLSKRQYVSTAWEIASICVVALLVIAIFYVFHGPIVTDGVELLTFAPVRHVEAGDLIMFLVLSAIIGSNIMRMHRFVMRGEPRVKVPLRLYVTKAKALFVHFATQIKLSKCKKKVHWVNHWLLMSGYGVMFVLIVILLRWFQTDNIYPIHHPQRLLGYYAFVAITYGCVMAIVGRLRKRDPVHRHSHASDWIFLILLLLTSVSGILVHALRYLELPLATYYMFTAHIAIAVPMLVLEVPFSKWAHLAYRPIAVYFKELKAGALQLEQQR